MPTIPVAAEDIAAGRALRTYFAHFWSTETGDPRDVYDRFVAATPIADGATIARSDDDPGAGIWVRPAEIIDDGVLLFLHGGGYGLGSAAAYAGLVSHLAAGARVAAFVLEYPLAPEAQLPVALDLAVATLRRLRNHYRSVAVAGDSAGGGLALATVAEAVQRGGIDIACAATFSPWTDLTLSGASVSAHAIGDPLLDPDYLRASAAAYLGDAAADDPRASPLFGSTDALPPLLIQVGTDEILCDDSVRYADAVRAAGGQVRLEVWEGMHHVFQLNVEQLGSARRAVASASDFIAAHLSR
jgi:epsilon-lactone hydrolase